MISIRDAGGALALESGGTELGRYELGITDPQVLSPRPYLHPLRTRAGHVVSIAAPEDHLWHKGLSLALPNVGPHNFWGGVTYRREGGYQQLPNNGAMRPAEPWETTTADDAGVIRHRLEWWTEDGDLLAEEDRTVTARLLDDAAWVLEWTSDVRNVSPGVVPIGSPTTEGRDNAGYGGIFWRGPESFAGARLLGPDGREGEGLRGSRGTWAAAVGTHEDGATSTIVMVDLPGSLRHPPLWFARSEPFACLGPAPFFDTEHPWAPDEGIRFSAALAIVDGGLDADAAGRMAAAVAGGATR